MAYIDDTSTLATSVNATTGAKYFGTSLAPSADNPNAKTKPITWVVLGVVALAIGFIIVKKVK